MRVILLKNVDDLGSECDVKDVADGYARNFLIPKGLAKIATKKELQQLEAQKEILAKKEEKKLEQVQEIISRLNMQEVSVSVKTGDEGQLFEAVSSAKIVKALKELGFEVKKDQINLEKPIKELGEFPLKVSFDHGLETEIKIVVVEEK